MIAILLQNKLEGEKTMPELKLFSCAAFLNDETCQFTAINVLGDVINASVDHLVNEHEFIDSPKLREDIKNSLTDA